MALFVYAVKGGEADVQESAEEGKPLERLVSSKQTTTNYNILQKGLSK